MNLGWYLNRVRKMGKSEVFKRGIEFAQICWSQIKYRQPHRWPYERFALKDAALIFQQIKNAEIPKKRNWKHYFIYHIPFDLTGPIDWYFSHSSESGWPASHYATIDYRPNNKFGDVRINWELNRMQFLPTMTLDNEKLAKKILTDWMENNRFLHGPAYIASMEVALRWISIYRSVCLFKHPLEKSFLKKLSGLAMASGRFIQSRLSTHSSAGNHLIVEAVGLFWIGKAFENSLIGKEWVKKARSIINQEILKQINPDGSSVEQSFWYLGFVLDAVFHYFLLEKRDVIPPETWERVGQAISFIDDLSLPNGSYPDFGDRDDGFVFRPFSNYTQPPFRRLVETGSNYFRAENGILKNHQGMLFGTSIGNMVISDQDPLICNPKSNSDKPLHSLKVYPNGGMSLMKHGPGRILFRHASLGLAPLFGHGHADALSILFWWNDIPVLTDLGSGQYNCDQNIRNYFRSTIAHNTIEVGRKNQATIKGPFMWEKSYRTTVHHIQQDPWFRVCASHDGYVDSFSTIHQREIEWRTYQHFTITDRFRGPGGTTFRGAFHLGSNDWVRLEDQTVRIDFGTFNVLIDFPKFLKIDIFYGSEEPFFGWHSRVYGAWKPNFSVVFSGLLSKQHLHTISIKIEPK